MDIIQYVNNKNVIIMKNKLGNILREERISRGWSLVDVAKKLDISKSQVHNFEMGVNTRVKMKALKDFASLYNLPLDEVVILGGRIPEDVYYKITDNPHLIKIIREL
jgi:transcriptional regulator with XRE-family HTH domain